MRLAGRRLGRRAGLGVGAMLFASALAFGVWRASTTAGAVKASPGPSGLAMPHTAPPGWKVAFSDNFNSRSLSPLWQTYSGQPGKDPGGWWDPSHDVVTNGQLQLRAFADAAHCQASQGCRSYDQEVTGGVKLRLNWTYGRFLVRMRARSAQGVSIVALLWPIAHYAPPEIDFTEDNGASPRRVDTATLHYGSPELAIHHLLNVNLARWHTVGVQWSPGKIAYTIDGRRWAVIHGSAVPSIPMNLAIQDQTWECGLTWDQCPGSGPAPRTSLDIDWVVVETPDR